MSCDCWEICDRVRDSGVSDRMGGGGAIGVVRPGGSISSNLDFVGEDRPPVGGEVLERVAGFIQPLLLAALGVIGKREKDGDLA